MRLVEICVDGGLEATMYEAQAQLADAYLEVGPRPRSAHHQRRPGRARAVEPRQPRSLPARPGHAGGGEPGCDHRRSPERRQPVPGHRQARSERGRLVRQRLRRRPRNLRRRRRQTQATAAEDAGRSTGSAAKTRPHRRVGRADRPALRRRHHLQRRQRVRSTRCSAGCATRPAGSRPKRARRNSIGLRSRITRWACTTMRSRRSNWRRGRRGSASTRRRCSAGCISSARTPRTPSNGSRRAAEAPAPTPDAGRALLYDLAQTLEAAGESARALAVFVELESESGGYRDVAGRIDRLSKVQARG